MLGGSIASFLGVVIERTPKGESLNGRSHCFCGRPLKWYENIPVFGYIRVGGVAKCCGSKIPVWYFIFEVLLGLAFVVLIPIILYTTLSLRIGF